MENSMDNQSADEQQMDAQASIDETVHAAKESARSSVQTARKVARTAALTSIGLAGMAYDRAKSLWSNSAELLQQAENRGEQIGSDFNQRITELEQRTKSEIQKAKEQTEQNVRRKVDRVVRGTEDAVEESGVATPEQGAESSQEIAVVEETGAEKVAQQQTEPLPGYSTMNATMIMERLEGLPLAELEAIREYELAHANRRTLIEALNQRIAAHKKVS